MTNDNISTSVQFAGVENLMTGIVDTWPHLRKYKSWIAMILCVVLGILGLTMCSEVGSGLRYINSLFRIHTVRYLYDIYLVPY